MSDITEEDVMKYCQSRNLMLVTKESLEYMHRPIVIETMNKNAIPVEFIEEQIAKTTDISNRDELDVLYAGNLGYLLKLWEEENETTGKN